MGVISIALYAALLFKQDVINGYIGQGGMYAFLPIVTAFAFSFVHGTFTGDFWTVMGIEAAKKKEGVNNMHDIAQTAANFINLDAMNIFYLFFVRVCRGLVSGFIGSGGAFVLTPAMMSLGVPGLVAVASNMCHKFPKALIGRN